MSSLRASGIVGGYGGMTILNGASAEVAKDEIVVVIGPNGAGKSTLMKAIFGLVQVREGQVTLAGTDLTNHHPQVLVRQGLAYVPQVRNVFPNLSVEENLEMGAYLNPQDVPDALVEMYDLFPDLKPKRRQAVGELSGGQRQMVAIGRALMSRPRFLLLDEPTAGLAPKVMGQIFECILGINQTHVGILMVEQNAKKALEIAHRGYVLTSGENRFSDTAANLLANEEVAASFLGG
jgi:branched-chain amino acid transport system ATP-binding protein|tara:strand:+ start:1392 stop:2096 length:705 start_codon:yes stop_codon:yes gene_type:complete